MEKNMNGLSRELIIHPGETLKEMLENRGMSQRELAVRTDVTEKHISNIVNCQKPISVSFAKKLEYALGVEASFWINLQSNYDKELADFEEVNSISKDELEIIKNLNDIINYLKQLDLLDQNSNDAMLVIELRKLLNVSSLVRIPEISQTGAYRLATDTSVDPYVLFTWLRMCDLVINRQKVHNELDIEKLKRRIPLIKDLMFEDVNKIKSKLKEYFNECGIKFAIVKYFRGAPVQGVIKRNTDGTLSLIMTVRRKFAGIFWFTLFHEIGHILNGDIEDELIDYDFADSEIEEKANEFASETLIEPNAYKQFIKNNDFSLEEITCFCTNHNIPNYILIERLQKDQYISYNQYASEKVRYDLEE